LLKEHLKSILRGPRSSTESGPAVNDTSSARRISPPGETEALYTRPSRGIEQFFGFFRDQAGLTILDLGGAHQENINFITSLGHKFYSEDFLRILQEVFASDPADQSNPGRIEYFLRQSLDYPDEHFDGVLVWDVLEYMEPPLLSATVERLMRMIKPQGYLLAVFHSADRPETLPCCTFRIQDLQTLQVSQSGQRTVQHLFNNRGLEKLFQGFESVKFFLTRDSLREVIVRK
jgi:2-polyprenyl-3-methyl-5-hydroxy-6-metoxy-1,4-benzoquinol methylase